LTPCKARAVLPVCGELFEKTNWLFFVIFLILVVGGVWCGFLWLFVIE